MKKGSRKERTKSHQHKNHNLDENWSFKPHQSDPKSLTQPSSSRSISNFIPQNPRWESKKQASGSQDLKNYDLGSIHLHPKQGESDDKHVNKGKTESTKEEQVEKKELSGGFDAHKENSNKDVVVEEQYDGDVVTRLGKLKLFTEEPDLSEELLRQNGQLQEDEVNLFDFSLITLLVLG